MRSMNKFRAADVPARSAGFSLIELMISVLIGTFLIVGTLIVFSDSRAAIQVSNQLSTLQESARFAIQLIEDDARAAGFWGRTNNTTFVAGRATPAQPTVFVVGNSCTNNWAVNLDTPIEGSDEANPYSATCIPASLYETNTDVVVFRHADKVPVVTANLVAGQMYIRADEAHAEIFVGTTEPAGFAADAQNFILTTVAYFVAKDSTALSGVPSLRRAMVSTTGGATTVTIEELVPGVEDLQVQYGIDTDADGSVNSYVNADQVPNFAGVLAVRVWVRARSEVAELGFVDDAQFIYADRSFQASTSAGSGDDALRRVLASKTIELRNRRIAVTAGI